MKNLNELWGKYMLSFAFFISVFTSTTWIIYSLMYINKLLGENDFMSLNLQEMMVYLALVLLPILILWLIFGYIQQYFSVKSLNKKSFKLLQQMQKNQDYADLMVRIMINAEHEIKDGFVINKFDVFISDMNEMLADLLMRCNLVSSGQMETLWNKVLHGERWSIAKILIATVPVGQSIADRIFDYAKRDSIVAGTLMEFCARYQMLFSILEKHDSDGIFLNIIQTGVMGKAYSLLAPVSEQVQYGKDNSTTKPVINSAKIVNSVLDAEKEQPKKSILSSFSSIFQKKQDKKSDDDEDYFLSSLDDHEDLPKMEPSFDDEIEKMPIFEHIEPDEDDKIETDQNEKNEVSYPFGE